MKIKKCEICKNDFKSAGFKKPDRKRFCSRNCYLKYWQVGEKFCLSCKDEFNPKSSKKRKFCSRSCANRFNKVRETDKWKFVKCGVCHIEFTKRLNRVSDRSFCSTKCYYIWTKSNSIKGEKCWNWKGGISSTREYLNHYLRLYKVRKRGAEGTHSRKEWENLKEKYKYTCPSCLKSEPEIKLTIDHIIPLSKKGSNFIKNIQPLCRSCNSKKWNRHTYFAKPIIENKLLEAGFL